MRLRILVVEPDRHAREGLQAILAGEGHETSVAQDLAAGLSRLVAQRFDLLLLDADVAPSVNVRLGVVDFLRLVFRGAVGTRAILIASEPDALRAVSDSGVLTVLEKPVELSRLRHALRVAASGRERSAV
jgi:DNA-binding NtrC family response regulator